MLLCFNVFMISRRKLFLLLTLVLGFFLRLIYLQEWLHFEFDEEVIAWKLRQFVSFGKPFLIGGGTPFGFHLGPAFYYLSAIPLFFSRLDPIGWGVAAAILGVMTIWLMWLVGRNLYGRRVGLMAALFWATSFTAVMSDRHWWPLVLDPILSLAVILLLHKILKSGIATLPAKGGRLAMTSWLGLGVVLAFAWQADLTVLPLFLAASAVAIMVWREQKKGIMTAIAILLVSVLPLVLFELRHPGENLGKFLHRFNPPAGGLDLYTLLFIPQSLSRLLFPITHMDGNLLKFYSWCREIADVRVAGQPWWATGVMTILLLTPFIKARSLGSPSTSSGSLGMTLVADWVLRIVILSGVGGILLFKLMGGNLYDFYLAVLYPVVLILTAGAIDFIWRKRGAMAAGAIIMVIVGLNLTAIAKAHHPQGLAVKRETVAWTIRQLNGKDFELDSLSGCSRYNGMRYLFFLENMEPYGTAKKFC